MKIQNVTEIPYQGYAALCNDETMTVAVQNTGYLLIKCTHVIPPLADLIVPTATGALPLRNLCTFRSDWFGPHVLTFFSEQNAFIFNNAGVSVAK